MDNFRPELSDLCRSDAQVLGRGAPPGSPGGAGAPRLGALPGSPGGGGLVSDTVGHRADVESPGLSICRQRVSTHLRILIPRDY